MKNFLKSTAIFAWVALLFCACVDDTTEDLAIPFVDPSEIRAVKSGDSRALIQWDVPDDQNITECLITWKNNKNVNEVEYVPVIPGYTAEFEFFDLTEGDYELTVTNLNENRIQIDTEPATYEKYIYSLDTYTKRPLVLRVLTEWDAITITWSQIPKDCRGVYISYTDINGDAKVSSLQAVYNDDNEELEDVSSVGSVTKQTRLDDALPGSDFYFVTAFKPIDGLDTVYMPASETASVVSDYVAADPEGLTVQGGCDPDTYTTYSAWDDVAQTGSGSARSTEGGGAYFKVKWKVPANDEIIYSKVAYTLVDSEGKPKTDEFGTIMCQDTIRFGLMAEDGDTDAALAESILPTTDLYDEDYRLNDYITQGNINTRYIEVPYAGDYYIAVQNIKEGDLISDFIATEETTLVYNASTFELPAPYEMINDADQLTISWYDAPDHFSSMYLTYDCYTVTGVNSGAGTGVKTQTSQITANSDGSFDDTELSDVWMGDLIHFSVTYRPDNGLNDVTVETTEIANGSLEIPGYAPQTPTGAIQLAPGYNETNGSYVRVTWSVTWPGTPSSETITADALRLYYAPSGERHATAIEKDLSTDETTYDIVGLDPDVEYDIYLVSVAYSDDSQGLLDALTDSGTISEKVTETVTTYSQDTYTIASCPSSKAVLLSGDLTFAWGNDFSSDLITTVLTYDGVTYTSYYSGSGTVVPSIELDATSLGSSMDYVYNYATFCPEDGLDVITVAINDTTCSIVEPDIVYEAGMYWIYTSAGFKAFADLVNGSVNSTAVTWCEDSTFPAFGAAYNSIDGYLQNDIDLQENGVAAWGDNPYGWTTIGSSGNTYKGTFDGQGYTVSNLWINRPTTSYQGLFGYINGATIKNLTLKDADITGNGNTAGFATQLQNGSIVNNCHLTGSSKLYANGTNNGGIVGYSSGTTSIPCYIIGCSIGEYVELNAPASGATLTNAAFGGISGATVYTTYVNCWTEGTVMGERNVGGISGYAANATMVGCYTTETAVIYATARTTGGMIARTHNADGTHTIVGCYNAATIYCDSSSEVSSFVGCCNTLANFYACYNVGKLVFPTVSATSTSTGVFAGYMVTGGAYIFDDCYYYQEVTQEEVLDEEGEGTNVFEDVETYPSWPIYSAATTTSSSSNIPTLTTGVTKVYDKSIINSTTAVNAMNGSITSTSQYALYPYMYQVGTTTEYPTIVSYGL